MRLCRFLLSQHACLQVGVLLQHPLAEMRTLGAQVLHQFTSVQVQCPPVSARKAIAAMSCMLMSSCCLIIVQEAGSTASSSCSWRHTLNAEVQLLGADHVSLHGADSGVCAPAVPVCQLQPPWCEGLARGSTPFAGQAGSHECCQPALHAGLPAALVRSTLHAPACSSHMHSQPLKADMYWSLLTASAPLVFLCRALSPIPFSFGHLHCEYSCHGVSSIDRWFTKASMRP